LLTLVVIPVLYYATLYKNEVSVKANLQVMPKLKFP